MDPTLLITYQPAHPGKAEREVRALLEDFGAFDIIDARTPGLFLVKVENPARIVSQLRELPADSFENTNRWIPLQQWLATDIAVLQQQIATYAKELQPNDRWRLMLHKRGYTHHDSQELTTLLTAPIDHEHVDLASPTRLFVVEIVGDRTGLSFLRPREILDRQKL